MAKGITFANREVCNLTICDFVTQKPIHVLDYANATSQEITGEQVFAFGGQGHPRRASFYGEKGGNLTIETQIMSSELFSLMTGAEIETTAKFIKRLELTAAEGKLTLPAGTSFVTGSLNVYEASDDCGTPIEATVNGTEITLPVGNTTGEFVVYGIENINTGVKKMSVKSTTFPKAVTIYGETVMTGEDGVVYPYKMIVYKASPQQTFNFGFSNSGDPVSLTLTFELLADKNNSMMDLIIIEEDGGPALTSIAITTPPSNVDYTAGETFSTVGMVVTATYSDGTTGVVTGYSFTPAIPLTANDETITVSYTADGITKTATQAITVS